MHRARPHGFGPPQDRDEALAVLRMPVELGIANIDTGGSYGHVIVNQLIGEAADPYPEGLHITISVGARHGADGSPAGLWESVFRRQVRCAPAGAQGFRRFNHARRGTASPDGWKRRGTVSAMVGGWRPST